TVVAGHDHVEIAIVIEISKGCPAAYFRLRESRTHLIGNVMELSGPGVQEQVRRLFICHVRADIPNRIVDVTVDDEQIEQTVEVGVEKEAAEAEAAAGATADVRLWRPVGVNAI